MAKYLYGGSALGLGGDLQLGDGKTCAVGEEVDLPEETAERLIAVGVRLTPAGNGKSTKKKPTASEEAAAEDETK